MIEAPSAPLHRLLALLLVVAIASPRSLVAAESPAAPPRGLAADAAAAQASPAAARAPVRLAEGDWLVYEGTLKGAAPPSAERPGSSASLTVSLEAIYLVLAGASAPPGGDATPLDVLLLRRGESPDQDAVAFAEAISLRGAELRPVLPVADRLRVSWLPFASLPIDIFPSLASAAPARWRGPLRAEPLLSAPSELAARHETSLAPGGTLRYTATADPGQRLSYVQDRVEVAVELASLVEGWTIDPGKGRLLAFESKTVLRLPSSAGGAAEEKVIELDLVLKEARRIDGDRWTALRSEASAVKEIERSIFGRLDADAGAAGASLFEREHPRSQLAWFALGLGRQAESILPLAAERRLWGKPAPDFELRDLAGVPFRLSRSLAGKVTLLVFWSAASPAGRAQAPLLERLHRAYRDRGFQVIAVDADDSESRQTVAAFAARSGLTHLILVNGAAAADLFDFDRVLPTSFWIDRRGVVIRREGAFRPEAAKELERTIAELLDRRDEAASAAPPPGQGAAEPASEDRAAPSPAPAPAGSPRG